jgi:NAD(P)-dependent dehydrogenase (short-subunit alcohol dehydrogenase family)
MDELVIQDRNSTPFTFQWGDRIDLSDKAVLAFGGAGNLAETFLYAAACCGAKVMIADNPPRDDVKRAAFEDKVRQMARNLADLSPHGPPPIYYADVTKLDEVLDVFSAVGDAGEGVDIAVDFAGISHPPFDLVAGEPAAMLEHFRRVVDVNLTGAFIVTLAAARHMVPRRRGHIIHLCSSGSRLSLYATYAYNATKHGVEGLVKTAATQLSPLGVRVNGIAPGTVETDLNRSLLRHADGGYRPRALSILAHTPSKRFATRVGVAETLMAMCLEQRHFTGNVVFADDGYNVEGHSWPEGNIALYRGSEVLEDLVGELSSIYPRDEEVL